MSARPAKSFLALLLVATAAVAIPGLPRRAAGQQDPPHQPSMHFKRGPRGNPVIQDPTAITIPGLVSSPGVIDLSLPGFTTTPAAGADERLAEASQLLDKVIARLPPTGKLRPDVLLEGLRKKRKASDPVGTVLAQAKLLALLTGASK